MKCPICGCATRVDNTIATRGRAIRARTCDSSLCRLVFQTAEVPIGPAEAVAAVKMPNLAALVDNTAAGEVVGDDAAPK